MENVIDKILIDESEMQELVKSVAFKLAESYSGVSEVFFVYILEGAHKFATALLDHLNGCETKFTPFTVKASSYYETTSSTGEVDLNLMGLENRIKDKDVLLVDDIFDTGKTLEIVSQRIAELSPASLKTCVMLERRVDFERGMKVDFIGRLVEQDYFLIGYGLDYKGQLRELPYIATVKEEYQ